jgi:hypothetical protein
MTGPPQTPNPAGGEASGAQTSDQLGRQIDGKNIQSAIVVKPPPAGRVFRGQRQIGAWIQTNDGFAAWSMDSRIGVYETPGLAANAALDAYFEAKAAKSRARAVSLRKGKAR